MPRFRTAAKLAGFVALAIVVVLATTVVALQIKPVQHWLLAKINQSLTGEAHLSGFSGTIPTDMRVGRIELDDSAGRWAVIHDAVLKLDPTSLLRGRIGIDLLSSHEIRVERKPQSSGGSSSSGGGQAFPFELRRLDLPKIDLEPPVLGEEVALSVVGNAELWRGRTEAHLDVHRLDDGAGRLDARLDLSGQPLQLRVAVNVDDPSGNLLDMLLARSDHLPLSARFSGEGPLADWHGRLAATAGDAAHINADVFLSNAHAVIDGRADIAALLPQALRDPVGNSATFHLSAAQKPNGDIVADALRLDLAAAKLDGTASMGTGADGPIKAGLTAEAADLSRLSSLLGEPAMGSAQIQLAVSGTKETPAADTELTAKNLRLAGIGAGEVVAHVKAKTTQGLSDPNARVIFSGDGEIRGIAARGSPLMAGNEHVAWTLAGSAKPTERAVAVDNLTVDGSGITLTAKGHAEGAHQTLAGTLHLTATDLSRLSGFAGRELSGHGAIDATISREASGAAQLGVTGSLGDLATGIPAINGLLGGRLDIDISALRAANGDLDVRQASIEAANLHTDGRARIEHTSNRADGAFTIDVPQIDALSTTEQPVGGHVRLDGTIGGTATAPQLEARLSAGNLALGGSRLDRVKAKFTASGDANPEGRLEAEFQSEKLSGMLNGTFALNRNDKTLDLPNVSFTAGGTTIRAALHTALDSHLTRGEIDARSADLSQLSTLVGTPLSGTMRLQMKLTASNSQSQGISFSLSGAKLSFGSDAETRQAVERITANGRFSDVLATPRGDANLDLQGATFANAAIDHLHSSITSRGAGRFGFDTNFAGSFKGPLELSTAGTVEVAKDSIVARITKFSGTLRNQAFKLDAPLRLAKSDRGASMSGLNLALGSGRVNGSAALKGEHVAAKLSARGVPLALAELALASNSALAGTAGADLDLGGTIARPTGRIAITAQGFRMSTGTSSQQPAIDVTADARLLPGRVALQSHVAMAAGDFLEAKGEVPIRIHQQPFAVSIARDQSLTMQVEGNGRLEDIAEALPIMGEDKWAGAYHLELRVSGTVASPNASGRLTLRNGHYESFTYGTVLDGMTLDLVGDNDRIVLQRFSATDGDKGTVEIRGTSLLAATTPTVDISIALRKFRFVRNDEAIAHASGDLRVADNIAEPRVTGSLQLNDAEIYLPDRMPPSVRNLDVTVVDSATGKVIKESAPPSGKQSIVASLDVTLDIPGQTFVRGRGLDSEWKGRFHATGTSSAPQIDGALQVVHGTMDFLGKTLTLSRGTITLVGGNKIEPNLDFLAESAGANITAQVAVTGPAEHPKITLTSNPPLPQDQILAQLLFGRDVTQLSPLEGAQIAQAAATLASGGPSVIDRVRMKTGLDRLSIGSADQAAPGAQSAPSTAGAGAGASTGAGNTAVSGGKYVAPGTYVGVTQGASGESQALVEVEITRHLDLNATAGASRGNSVGVQWKLDY